MPGCSQYPNYAASPLVSSPESTSRGRRQEAQALDPPRREIYFRAYAGVLEDPCLKPQLPNQVTSTVTCKVTLRYTVSDFSHYCWGPTTAVLLRWPFSLGKTSLGEAHMLFYHHATAPCPCRRLDPGGVPWRPKSRRISNKSSWAQGLCEIVAHCRPKSPKRRHRAPKWCSKAHL